MKNTIKLSILFLIAILFSVACSKSTPKDDGDIKILCEKYPESDYCTMISDKTNLKLEDAKPIQSSSRSEELLYWSDPLYAKGFQYKKSPTIRIDFSIDSGSSLKEGDAFTTYIYLASDGSKIIQSDTKVSDTLGGGRSTNGGPLLKLDVGDILIVIAVFPDNTYLNLPPIEIVE